MIMDNKPIILVGNDDGIEARGLKSLIEFLAPMGELYVAAPATHQSAKSSSLTMDTPLRVDRLDDYMGARMFRINGTPVDCTKMALNRLLPRRPDLIVAGINHGANSGSNVIYSGTMGVVFEGCLAGIPSIGFSLLDYRPDADFSACRPIVEQITADVLANGLPADVCLNVNIPAGTDIKGIKVCRAAHGTWTEEFEQRTDPFGRNYYWITGSYSNTEPDSIDTDLYYLEHGFASVVPCRPDQTAHDAIALLASRL